mmetsp:Transcript_25209/g.45377  ORF Transcript_25209/g.45377 Transcript_25209/m.45377 type:complete len:283 (+) Transcript_25209:131-979(+)
MKQVSLLMWSAVFVFALVVACSDAWSCSPGAVHVRVHRQRAVALRSSKAPVIWVGNELENEDASGLANMAKGSAVVSRRNLFRGASVSAIGVCWGWGRISPAHAWTVDRVEPDENDIYAEAQNTNTNGPLRVLWVGSGAFQIRSGAARSGVYKNLFRAGNEVTAVDLLEPNPSDLRSAKRYAHEQGYGLRFRQGDATRLNFETGTFDVVVCSLFLCQDFDPEVVVCEIKRVLRPGGRFGFYEHVEDIDKVVVGKVFGEPSVVRIEAYPEKHNILAGVVRKVS